MDRLPTFQDISGAHTAVDRLDRDVKHLLIEARSILAGTHALGSETIRRSIELQQLPDQVAVESTPDRL